MVESLSVDDLGRVRNVEHLMIKDVSHDESRHLTVIQRFAYDDGVECRIMMPKNVIGSPLRPRESRPRKLTLEILLIKLIEDLREIVYVS